MVPRWLLVCCVVLCARPAHPQGAQQCPAPNTMTPCSCTVKKNGLDILCEFTEQQHIQKVSRNGFSPYSSGRVAERQITLYKLACVCFLPYRSDLRYALYYIIGIYFNFATVLQISRLKIEKFC